MLHTLWTCSLFCVWGRIVQEEPLPWSNIGATGPTRWGPRGWGRVGAHPDGTSPAQGSCHLRLQSSWVCVWGSKASGGTARANSMQNSAPVHYWTHTSWSPLKISGCLGEWWSHAMDRCELTSQGCICGTGRKVGIDTFVPCALARWCASSESPAVVVLLDVSLLTMWPVCLRDANLRNYPGFYLE